MLIYFGKRSLIAYDEGFYAVQARWIIDNSNWVGAMWWDTLTTDRTIAIQFLLALSKKIFGESLFALYIPILVASIMMIFTTYHLHKELLRDKYPLYSSLILATTFLWISYAHMATQDIVFASLVNIGLLSSIKAYKTSINIYFILSGLWIGLAFFFKTYLTFIPFVCILPFLLKSKIFYKKYFWIGIFIGFIPFTLWSYNYIFIYGYESYSGIFRKLVSLSKNNNFTKPFYYYSWNMILNIFPWSILSIVGFFKSFKGDFIRKYFLFFYPFFLIILLSLFSTKTPYYPLQILSLTSINSFVGINYILNKKEGNIISYLGKINFILIPIIFLFALIILNFINIIELDLRAQIFMNLGVILFSLSWISIKYFKNKKVKFLLSILGPYILVLMLVQSGLITDKSKSLRIASEELINSNNLSDVPINIIYKNSTGKNSTSKIIKIMLNIPKLGKNIENLEQLKANSYAWTTSNKYYDKDNYYVVDQNKEFYPWKLIMKK